MKFLTASICEKPLHQPEIDISVSKLLGFETFAKSLRVSVSVSENLVSEKSLGLGFGKFGLGKEKIQITRTVLVMMSQILDLVPKDVEKSRF